MPIHYALFEDNITADPDDYMAMMMVGWASRPPAAGRARPAKLRLFVSFLYQGDHYVQCPVLTM